MPLAVFSQYQRIDFTDVDRKAMQVDFAAPASLAQALTSHYTKDIDKVRSIFRWITENIHYKVRSTVATSYNHLAIDPIEDTCTLKPLNQRVAELVLQRGDAVCDGYARLFKTLCDFASIPSEVVSGFADGGFGRRKFRSNHKWNAVLIDSTWHLLDVTWASGGTSYSGDKYVKNFNDQYFCTPPETFIRDHYPDDLKWTLLPKPPVVNEYNRTPFATASFYKNYIVDYKPVKGIIESTVGDTLRFEIATENNEPHRNFFVMDKLQFDSTSIAQSSLQNTLPIKLNKKMVCTYIVTTEAAEWLHIIMNNEVIMRYKLNVRNSFSGLR